MKADNISKRWQVEVCQNERIHAENTHINIDNGINGGENTRSGENTHTYPIFSFYFHLMSDVIIIY